MISALKPLFEKIFKPGVSDLHLKANEPPLVRHLGQLSPLGNQPIKAEELNDIVKELLSERQKELLQKNDDLDFSYEMEGVGRMRINVYRQQDTWAIVFRPIPPESKSFEELHLPKETLEKISQTSRGLILVSGVTGAGKTTTLNAIINYINQNFSYNIITLEDPVELTHKRVKSSIAQREVGRDVKTLREGILSALRQDPDILVIGELREASAFQPMLEAAASGHLVLATVHSSDTFDAMDRIVAAFSVQEQLQVRAQLINVLKVVISQRLVHDKTGKMILPATEIMFGTLQLKKLLAANSQAEARFLLEKGTAFGMHTFDQDLLRLVEQGLISSQEALNNASNAGDLRLKLQGQSGSGIELGKTA